MNFWRFIKFFGVIGLGGIILSGIWVPRNSVYASGKGTDQFEVMAQGFEDKGDYDLSLYYWHIVKAMDPDNGNVTSHIRRLKEKMKVAARQSFEDAQRLLRQNKYSPAKKALLLTLKYDPSHRQALELLKNLAFKDYYLEYTVRKGDTPKRIAQKVYKDRKKSFLISFLHNWSKKSKPKPGTVIRLPVIEKKRKAAPASASSKTLLKKAKTHLRKKEYDKVLAITKSMLQSDYLNSAAIELQNAAFYEKGKQLMNSGKTKQALKMFNRVESDYKDVEQLISRLRGQIKNEAEDHYRAGVKYFVEEDLENAIKEWKKTLALDPSHKKARKDIRNARRLLEKLKKVK